VMKPDYAEGWNRRATLHFMMNDYGRSMADIQKTLTLEPRHFGAMAGMAAILKDTGRKEAALQAFERVLTVYPMMREAQKQAGELADELTGQRT
jgi:tetratricopeptide (TPR) repeat protein